MLAGSPILAEDVLFARLTATTSLTTSSTSLQNVTGLSVSVVTNAVYVVDCLFLHDNVAGTTEDIQYGFTFPSGATFTVGVIGGTAAGVSGSSSTDVSVVSTDSVSSGVTAFPFGCSTSGTAARVRGVLITSSTAGTFQVQASQATSGGNASRVRRNSHITLTRVA